jgi:hypothetical protein
MTSQVCVSSVLALLEWGAEGGSSLLTLQTLSNSGKNGLLCVVWPIKQLTGILFQDGVTLARSLRTSPTTQSNLPSPQPGATGTSGESVILTGEPLESQVYSLCQEEESEW